MGVDDGHGDGANVYVLDVELLLLLEDLEELLLLNSFEELLDEVEDVLDIRREELLDVVGLIVDAGFGVELDTRVEVTLFDEVVVLIVLDVLGVVLIVVFGDVFAVVLLIAGSRLSRGDATAKSPKLASRGSNRIGSNILTVIHRTIVKEDSLCTGRGETNDCSERAGGMQIIFI